MEIRTHHVKYTNPDSDLAGLISLLSKGWDVMTRFDGRHQSTFVLRRRLSLWARAVGLFRKKGPKSWALKRNV